MNNKSAQLKCYDYYSLIHYDRRFLQNVLELVRHKLYYESVLNEFDELFIYLVSLYNHNNMPDSVPACRKTIYEAVKKKFQDSLLAVNTLIENHAEELPNGKKFHQFSAEVKALHDADVVHGKEPWDIFYPIACENDPGNGFDQTLI